MSIIIDGTGTISGVSATGLTTAQTVGYSSLPAGSVLQVVQSTYATQVSSTSSSFSDTGLTASITPKYATSKILVVIDHVANAKSNGNTYIQMKLLRGATTLNYLESIGGFTNNTNYNCFGGIGMNYLDSPATTSSTTYKTQFCSGDNSTPVYVQQNNGFPTTSTITLMEIAA
jgi:hypothetical protein